MYTVYVLKSLKNNYRYIGQTNNLNKRLNEHNSGLSKSTKNIRPLVLDYSEEYATRSEAMKRERFLKSGKGREWLTSINH
ncbi:MAG: putative endonuclease [Patescibacteria group bacterium]|nr:putative endonuclease [Patescibacteria group bacterium]